jgi:hypothetical protein
MNNRHRLLFRTGTTASANARWATAIGEIAPCGIRCAERLFRWLGDIAHRAILKNMVLPQKPLAEFAR